MRPFLALVAVSLLIIAGFIGFINFNKKQAIKDSTPASFKVERIKADNNWTVCYVLTDTKTNKRYLVNYEGGTPLEISSTP